MGSGTFAQISIPYGRPFAGRNDGRACLRRAWFHRTLNENPLPDHTG
jgi:hypothetical protein